LFVMLLNSSSSGRRLKRLFDISFSVFSLALLAPLLICAAIGICLASPGPILYPARRVGKDGHPYTMFKFRTMHLGDGTGSVITAPRDQRIFALGRLLRRLKLDELPQLFNILRGDMSVVGPRPEDPLIVDQYYNQWMKETLAVRPGVTSPGAIYGYIYGDSLLEPTDPEGSYVRYLLQPKLALERAYLSRAGFFSDLAYIFLTAWAIVASVAHLGVVLPSVDVRSARRWAPQGPFPCDRE
jgi:lipopolysaccharide/colanic/teichoic acid biosynthesis glycosyltransferase